MKERKKEKEKHGALQYNFEEYELPHKRIISIKHTQNNRMIYWQRQKDGK